MNSFLSRLKVEPAKKKEMIFILLVILISAILRIPALVGPVSNDVWFIIWESRLLFEGHLNDLIIHPFSVFGAYLFSPYPIGSLVAFRFFDIISFKNEFLAVNLYTFFFVAITAIFSFKFFKYIFNDQREGYKEDIPNYLAFIGSLFYINFPYLIYFSYNNASARLPIMTIIPLFMLYSLQAIRKYHYAPYLKSLGLFILMFFFHRMVLPLLIVPILVGLYLIVQLVIKKNEKLSEKYQQLKDFVSRNFVYVFAIILVVLLAIGFLYYYLVNASLFNYGVNNIFLAYLTHIFGGTMYNGWGTLVFISLFGLVLLSSRFRIKTNSSYTNIQYLILLLLPLTVFLSNPYDIYLVVIVPIILALYYIQHFAFKTDGIKPILNASLLIFFGSAIVAINALTNFGQTSLSFYLPILIIVGCFSIIMGISILVAYFHTKNTRERRISFAHILKQAPKIVPIVLVASSMIYSRFYIDLQTILIPKDYPNYFPSNTLTVEEEIIANYMSSTPKTLFGCVTHMTGIRISVLSGCFDISDAHSLSLLLTGYYTIDEIKENATLKPIYLWWEVSIYDLPDNMLTGREIFEVLVRGEANTTSLDLVHALNLEYFISYKNSNITELSINQWIESPFIQNIDNIASMVFATEKYYLWSFD